MIIMGCLLSQGLNRGFAESLFYIFHSGTFIDLVKGFLEMVKLSSVFIVSLVTCIDSSSQHINLVVVYILIIGDL